jgi:hypothetical protein
MKKMPNEGGGTMATAATGWNPYSKEKTCEGREDSNAIADPAKRRKRSAGDDDVLGEALERTKKRTRRSSGPSPAEYDDGPPSRDCGGQLPIFKVFNVGGYDGSVQVPKPSAILFRRTSTIALRTAVTPPTAVPPLARRRRHPSNASTSSSSASELELKYAATPDGVGSTIHPPAWSSSRLFLK